MKAMIIFAVLAFSISAYAQPERTANKELQAAVADQLKVCHKIHEFILGSVDNLPYQSPLDVMKTFKNAKHISERCTESANSIIDSWQGMDKAGKKRQEKEWSNRLGFPFDKVIEDYNFFNWMVANTTDKNTK